MGEEFAQQSEQHTHTQQTDSLYHCGVCGGVFEEETNEIEIWIGCEQCDSWFHATCLGLDPSDPEDIVSM